MYDYYVEKFKKSIPEEDYDILRSCGAMIAGGACLSILSGKEINDYDVYFKSERQYFSCLLHYTDSSFMSHTQLSVLFNHSGTNYNFITFQYFNDFQEIFDTFDFTVCMVGFDLEKEEFVFDPRFHEDIIGKKLIYSTTNSYPIGTLLRVNKYIEKGYNISRREMLKIAFKIACLELDTIEDAERHMQGMYGLNIGKAFEGEYSKEAFIEWLSSTNKFKTVFEERDRHIDVNKILSTIVKSLYTNPELICFSTANKEKYLYDPLTSLMFYADECDRVPTEGAKLRLYKWVCNDNGELHSFFDNKFRYEIGKKATSPYPGIYTVTGTTIANAPYANHKNAVCIEIIADTKYVNFADYYRELGYILRIETIDEGYVNRIVEHIDELKDLPTLISE